MQGSGSTIEEERVRRYIAMAKGRLAEAVEACSSSAVLDQARRYLFDAEHHLGRGDSATALASVSYSHGLLDGCLGEGHARAREPWFLGKIFLNDLRGTPTVAQLASSLDSDEECVRSAIRTLEQEGLVHLNNGQVHLAPAGRSRIKVGLVAGVFDLVHPGHLAFLKWAKSQVDVLTVVIARDPSSKMRKGREPVQSESDRLAIVSELRPVDYACLGDQHDIYSPVIRIRPDLIILGKDQDADAATIRSDLAKRGLNAKVIRSDVWHPGELSKTSTIIDRIEARLLRGRREEG